MSPTPFPYDKPCHLRSTPPPQVAEHPDHCDQSEATQSTGPWNHNLCLNDARVATYAAIPSYRHGFHPLESSI